jgi:hypothetical protein
LGNGHSERLREIVEENLNIMKRVQALKLPFCYRDWQACSGVSASGTVGYFSYMKGIMTFSNILKRRIFNLIGRV